MSLAKQIQSFSQQYRGKLNLQTRYYECHHEARDVRLTFVDENTTDVADSCSVCAGILKSVGYEVVQN
jgi:hypothetical protein